MKTRSTIIEIICVSFILLWSYAAFSKLADLDKSRSEMLNQVFPMWIAEILYWLVPTLELGLCALLISTKTRLMGLYASLILMSSFTLYIGIVMTGVFGRVPCSCGGILNNMSYGTHLVFNLFFVALALFGIIIAKRWATFRISMDFFKKKGDCAAR
jgi:hypothetical protein